MTEKPTHPPTPQRSEPSRDGSTARPGRRRVLKATGATVVGAGSLAAGSASVASQIGGPSVDVIEVDDGGWFGSWSADDDLPVVDELFVFVHGWFGDTTVASQAQDVAAAMADGGYEADAYVALEWPATTLNFFGAESDTEDVGSVAAGLAEDFYDAGGDNLRLVGHSLGGRCVLWTAEKLDAGYEIETIAPLGAAADGDTVCPGGIWHDGIAESAGVVRNYHSEDDSTVGSAYGGLFGAALGTDGSGCESEAPDNYVDVDVTDSVGDHFEFLGDEAVGADLAANLDSTDENEDDGGWFDWF